LVKYVYKYVVGMPKDKSNKFCKILMKFSHRPTLGAIFLAYSLPAYSENQIDLSYHLDSRDFNTLTFLVNNYAIGVIPPFITEVRSRG